MQRKLCLVVLALALGACATWSGIAVAPNGAVWLATNVNSFGGQTAGPVYVCSQRAGELQCTAVPVRGAP